MNERATFLEDPRVTPRLSATMIAVLEELRWPGVLFHVPGGYRARGGGQRHTVRTIDALRRHGLAELKVIKYRTAVVATDLGRQWRKRPCSPQPST